MAVKRFTEEEISKVNNVNIVDYINKLNLETKRAGKTLKVEGYGGLHIDPVENRWNCFSERKGGGPIQLVMYLENKTWIESVKSLLGSGYKTSPMKANYRDNEKGKDKVFTLPQKNNTYNHMLAYLIKTRGIDKDVVYKFVNNKMLYEDKRKNCVFVGYDKENNPKYAGLRGTNTNIPFKGETGNSSKAYSFNIANKEDKGLFVFESPIELMSYMTLYKKHYGKEFNSNSLSLAGASDVALERFLKDNDITTIHLCLDNDKAGIEATDWIKEKYKDDYIIKIETPNSKDWNEDLVYPSDIPKTTNEFGKIEIAKNLIMNFIAEEYGDELRPFDEEDIERIGIAHTTTEDGERDIDVELDLLNCKINKYVDGELIHTEEYENLDNFIEELTWLNFDELVYLDIQDKTNQQQSNTLEDEDEAEAEWINPVDRWDLEL